MPEIATKAKLSAPAQRIQDHLRSRGFAHQVIECAKPTRSAAEAAKAVGCRVAQIAKSVVFRAMPSGRPVMVVTSGANRVDEKKVEALIGEELGRANTEFVRLTTGFAIGGVPPLGHAQPLTVFIDEDLMAQAKIWAAGGSPNALFALTPAELVQMTGGRIADVKA